MSSQYDNSLVILGPTASGKTGLGVHLARAFDGEILSADSRQVYRGLDIGSGKDLHEYSTGGKTVHYHLIDIVGLEAEFNVFSYQRAFHEAFEDVTCRGKLPVVVGGTGLYLEAVLTGYRMVEAPEDTDLRERLSELGDEELVETLRELRSDLHNVTDTTDRDRTIRAIEIASYSKDHPPEPAPEIRPLILGIRWKRQTLREWIAARLKQRLDAGLVEEVEGLHSQGVSWERMDLLGLEYRHVSRFLKGEIENRNDLFQKLNGAIAQFAKRQETWFRRMERNGTEIHWIDNADFETALGVVRRLL